MRCPTGVFGSDPRSSDVAAVRIVEWDSGTVLARVAGMVAQADVTISTASARVIDSHGINVVVTPGFR
jgi:hypothetical protein